MARRKIPDAIEMKRLKYGVDIPPAARDAVANALRAEGRLAEAILLYESRPGHADLQRDLATAASEGFSFHVLALRRMGTPVSDDVIRQCATAAEAKGRWLDAHRCYTALGDADALARVAEKLPGFKVAVPANKV